MRRRRRQSIGAMSQSSCARVCARVCSRIFRPVPQTRCVRHRTLIKSVSREARVSVRGDDRPHLACANPNASQRRSGTLCAHNGCVFVCVHVQCRCTGFMSSYAFSPRWRRRRRQAGGIMFFLRLSKEYVGEDGG